MMNGFKDTPDVLLGVPGDQRQVEDKRQPVSVDKEQEGQESVDTGLRNDVGVEAVAKVNRVDVVTAKIRSASNDSDVPARFKTKGPRELERMQG
jgi:hypothetical protein